MNKRRLRQMAAFLDKLSPEYFHMNYYGIQDSAGRGDAVAALQVKLPQECGTFACIAGWAFSEYRGTRPGVALVRRCDPVTPLIFATMWFGLSEDEGLELFVADSEIRWAIQSPKRAAAVLRHLVDTGEVDWHFEAAA